MRFTPLGDQAITITLGDSIDEPTRRRVHAATSRIERAALPGIVDLVPGFASVTLHYDPAAVPAEASYEFLVERLTPLLASTSDDAPPSARVIEIPVCYGGDLGPDLGDVAARHEMSEDEVVALHSAGMSPIRRASHVTSGGRAKLSPSASSRWRRSAMPVGRGREARRARSTSMSVGMAWRYQSCSWISVSGMPATNHASRPPRYQ